MIPQDLKERAAKLFGLGIITDAEAYRMGAEDAYDRGRKDVIDELKQSMREKGWPLE